VNLKTAKVVFDGLPNKGGKVMKQFQGSNKIIIGAIYPKSGSFAPVGREIKRALSLALDIVNNEFHLPLPLANTIGLPRLGNRKIQLVFADTKGNPAQGRIEADRLIEQEGVVALIWAYQSNVTEVASLISEAKKYPLS
jgi:branched-chain amino acid transport system substrate-binding protein